MKSNLILIFVTGCTSLVSMADASNVPEACKLKTDKNDRDISIVNQRLREDINTCLGLFAVKTALDNKDAQRIRDQEIVPLLEQAKAACAAVDGEDPKRGCFQPLLKARVSLVNYFAKIKPAAPPSPRKEAEAPAPGHGSPQSKKNIMQIKKPPKEGKSPRKFGDKE